MRQEFMNSLGLKILSIVLFFAIAGAVFILLKKKPQKSLWVAVLMSSIGMYLLCVDGGLEFEAGDLWLLGCAVFYAMHIIAVGHFAP